MSVSEIHPNVLWLERTPCVINFQLCLDSTSIHSS